jgi:cold shock CspA family protein
MTEEKQERIVGSELGQVKWFDNKLGYGFITVLTNNHKGTDIFVHQTNISPLETEFRTLMKGEYISLNVSNDEKVQAINVTGVLGGSLRCDEPRPVSRRNGGVPRPTRENSEESN